jgi:hypothetical protein
LLSVYSLYSLPSAVQTACTFRLTSLAGFGMLLSLSVLGCNLIVKVQRPKAIAPLRAHNDL